MTTANMTKTKKAKLLTCSVADLLAWRPCDGWTPESIRALAGRKRRWTAMDVLGLKKVNAADRLWAVLRPAMIEPRILHELVCRFAEHVLKYWERKYPDDLRPRAAIAAKRAWLAGTISDAELSAARSDAESAARSAERRWQVKETIRVLKAI